MDGKNPSSQGAEKEWGGEDGERGIVNRFHIGFPHSTPSIRVHARVWLHAIHATQVARYVRVMWQRVYCGIPLHCQPSPALLCASNSLPVLSFGYGLKWLLVKIKNYVFRCVGTVS